MDEVLYESDEISLWIPALIGSASVLLFPIGAFYSVVLFLFALFVLIGAIVIWGNVRYHAIELRRSHLRVGRGVTKISDIDPAFGVLRASEHFDEKTFASLELSLTTRRQGGDVVFLGGAYGSGVFQSHHLSVIRDLSTGELLVFKLKDHDAFATVLASVIDA